MIISVHPIPETDPNIQFQVIYLCTKMDPIDLLSTSYINDFISDDEGVDGGIDDPFLLSYIYAN
jgi:hypothetical protein